MSRKPLFVYLIVVAGCTGTQQIELADPLAETDNGEAPMDIPGEPLLLELTTNRSHVIHLLEPEDEESRGRLQISSTVAGVMVSVDGSDPAPLPLSLEVPAGPHEVNATCRDSSSESFGVSVEAGATVHLRVCTRRRLP